MRRMVSRVSISLAVLGALAAASVLSFRHSAAEATENAADLALERTRKQVRMLDDLYKTAIVFINDTYVDDGNSTSAGEVARELFSVMRSKGWHDARLIDGTGKPLNEDNKPKGGFEQAAIKSILKGDNYYDEVTEENGKRFLRAATVVPVVNAKCLMCHPGHKVGDVLGAVSYKLEIE
ncbi:MAG TPA: DUF3365 domain-containing protein [Pirellulales bacterium]|nr:DUF3365 domain-containing protein [Pirellulales bacterium]